VVEAQLPLAQLEFLLDGSGTLAIQAGSASADSGPSAARPPSPRRLTGRRPIFGLGLGHLASCRPWRRRWPRTGPPLPDLARLPAGVEAFRDRVTEPLAGGCPQGRAPTLGFGRPGEPVLVTFSTAPGPRPSRCPPWSTARC